MPKQQKIK